MATQQTRMLIRVAGILLAETMRNHLRDMIRSTKPTEDLDYDVMCARLRDWSRDGRVKSFTDLHEIMDANTLGCSEEVLLVMHADIPPEGDEQKVQLALDVMNRAQDMVDEWIRDGGLKDEEEQVR